VHQDGLVHVSALSHKFVKDPREVVKAGDVVKVKVLEVDLQRQRIALTMRLDDPLGDARSARDARAGGKPDERGPRRDGPPSRGAPAAKPVSAPSNNALADAFARARKN